jgi:alpha-L-fucosidase 2
MKSSIKIILPVLFFGISISTVSGQNITPDETIWYKYPAQDWNTQSLHLGNGYMGASFYGGINQECFDIAEETFFAGGPNVTENFNYGILKGGKEHIAQIRQLILEDKFAEADTLCLKYLRGDFNGFGYFSTVGKLLLNFAHHNGEVKDYVRSLDLANSLGNVSYWLDGTNYRREYFCSYPDKVLVCRFSADKKGKISFDLDHPLVHGRDDIQYNVRDKAHEITFSGKLKINGLDFCIRIALIPEGGAVAFKDNKLSVNNADNVTLVYAIDTEYKTDGVNFKGVDPVAETQKTYLPRLQKVTMR